MPKKPTKNEKLFDDPPDLRFSPTRPFADRESFVCPKCNSECEHVHPNDITHKLGVQLKYVAMPERVDLKCPGCGYHLGCRKPADAES